jgi:hypothetical protein
MVDYKLGAMNIMVDALSCCDMKEDAAPYTLSAPTFLLFDDLHQEFNVSADLGQLMEEVIVGSHSARWQVCDGIITVAGRVFVDA